MQTIYITICLVDHVSEINYISERPDFTQGPEEFEFRTIFFYLSMHATGRRKMNTAKNSIITIFEELSQDCNDIEGFGG